MSQLRFRLALLPVVLLTALASAPAPALSLLPEFMNAGGETWDASRQSVVLAALAQWEASILDSNTVSIEFTYLNLGSGGALGQTASSFVAAIGDDVFPVDQGGCPIPMTAGNPCVTHSISFNSDRIGNLFFDLTLDTADDIPFSQFDAYSIALHEIGHALGFADGIWFNGFLTESESDKWGSHIVGTHFDPGGLNVALASASDRSHLPASADDLMSVSLTSGTRREISSTDLEILSLAHTYSVVSEPHSWILMLTGVGGLHTLRRFRPRLGES